MTTKMRNFWIARLMGNRFESLDDKVFNANYKDFQYDTDWQSILPVVEKIKKTEEYRWITAPVVSGLANIQQALKLFELELLHHAIAEYAQKKTNNKS